jgi:hypothetical protein
MQQLDLFTYEPTAVHAVLPQALEIAVPTLQPQPLNPHAVAWWTCKADFYLQLISKFMSGTRCSRTVRSHEIQRLHQLREQAKAQIQTYGG